MRALGLIIVLLIGGALPASAQSFAGCTKDQRGTLSAATRNAKALALSSSVNIRDDATFERWFGKYSRPNAERVRATFKAIFTTIKSGRVTYACDPVSSDGCEEGTYAWVYDDEPYLVHICPPFFELPTMAGLRPNSISGVNGTREGTIIHEVSHFRIVAATDDNCYRRDECSEMAKTDVQAAVENADSYQYFAEDVAFYGREAQILGKPQPDQNGD